MSKLFVTVEAKCPRKYASSFYEAYKQYPKYFVLTVDIMHVILSQTVWKFSLAQYFSQCCEKKAGNEHKNNAFNLILHIRFHFWTKVTYAIRQNQSFLLAFYNLLPPPSKRMNNFEELVKNCGWSIRFIHLQDQFSLPKFRRWSPPSLIPLLSPLLSADDLERTYPFNYRAYDYCRPFIDPRSQTGNQSFTATIVQLEKIVFFSRIFLSIFYLASEDKISHRLEQSDIFVNKFAYGTQNIFPQWISMPPRAL